MTEHAAHLLAEALRLPESDRGELAARLIDSLDSAADQDVEQAWGVEIQQRLTELRQGQVQPVSWPDARRLIMEDINEPGSA